MEKAPSFAPLAARLAAHAAGLRPVDGSRDTLAKFAALVMCALLDMLICMCEAMDARASDTRAVAGTQSATAAQRDRGTACVITSRAGRVALPRARRIPSPSLAREVGAAVPRLAAASSETVEVTTNRSWSAPGRLRFPTAAPPRNAVFPSLPKHAQIVTIS